MNKKDRMIIPTTSEPKIEELEWRCLNRKIWVGRLPAESKDTDSSANVNSDSKD